MCPQSSQAKQANRPTCNVRLLTELRSAESAIIDRLRGGVRLRSRLAALGFTPGVAITMLQNRGRGPIIVTLRDTRIALGRGEAYHILVVPE